MASVFGVLDFVLRDRRGHRGLERVPVVVSSGGIAEGHPRGLVDGARTNPQPVTGVYAATAPVFPPTRKIPVSMR